MLSWSALLNKAVTMPEPRIFPERFRDRNVLVTGAGSAGDGIGVGRACALAFAAEGARLCLVDRELDLVERTREMIEAKGGRAIVVCGDVSDPTIASNAVEAMLAAFGPPHVVINNVGIVGPREDAISIDIEAWSTTFDVNVKAALMFARAALPHMVSEQSGTILNITSVAALQAHGALAYGPSKAALEAMTREIAVMHGRDGIRANTIAPGYLWTPMAETSGGGEEARRLRAAIAPLGREGDAWDVASASLFLASEEARYISGVTLPVDGGATTVAPIAAYSRFLGDLIRG